MSVHTLRPLDRDGISQLLRDYPLVTVIEECAPNGSPSMQVKAADSRALEVEQNARAWETEARTKLVTFTLQDEFIHCYGSHEELLAEHGLSAAKICVRIGFNV